MAQKQTNDDLFRRRTDFVRGFQIKLKRILEQAEQNPQAIHLVEIVSSLESHMRESGYFTESQIVSTVNDIIQKINQRIQDEAMTTSRKDVA